MNDNESIKNDTDELLDDIAARIRNSPVPEYPGPPVLGSSTNGVPTFPRTAIFAVGCCVVVLCIVAITASRWNRPHDDLHAVEQVAKSDTRDEPESTESTGIGNPTVGPIQITSFDPTPGYSRMTEELDRLSSRLDRLETEVAVLEVRTGAASLLAEYKSNTSTTR